MRKILKSAWQLTESAVYMFLRIVSRFTGKKLTEQAAASFLQFVKFGIVGLSNTVISYMIYASSLLFFKSRHLLPETDYLAAQMLAFLLSVLWAYYWNDRAVFQTGSSGQRKVFQTLMKTYLTYSFTGLFLSGGLLILWVYIGIPKLAAPALNLLFTVPLNFLINKFWTFKADEKG